MHLPPNPTSQPPGTSTDEPGTSTPEIDILRQTDNPIDSPRRMLADPQPDTNAEVASFSDKTLKEDAAKRAYARDQKWQDHFSFAFICTFWLLLILFWMMIAILIFHWVASADYCWLTPEQLDTLKTIIAAALASKVISVQQEKLSTSKD